NIIGTTRQPCQTSRLCKQCVRISNIRHTVPIFLSESLSGRVPIALQARHRGSPFFDEPDKYTKLETEPYPAGEGRERG
ncbi:MAG: hypothetical protein FWC26_04745, partial [Fibromonadales bacterium]|nr:hypothetical protein [Fibromonadales bacterium]